MEVILAHPELQGFRRWVLATKDAHELVSRVWLHRAASAGTLDGTSRSEHAGESGLLEEDDLTTLSRSRFARGVN